jgi:hypothetical protein
MSRYRRLKIEGGAFFYTLSLADRGSDLSVRVLINSALCIIRLAVKIGLFTACLAATPILDVMEKSHDRR